MSPTTHPDLENIIHFLDNPDLGKHHDLELHLATCSECRNQADHLTQLQHNLRSSEFSQLKLHHDISNTDTQRLPANYEHSIAQYLGDNLSTIESNQVAQLIHQNPQALKAALHCASHQSAMTSQLIDSVVEKKLIKMTSSFTIKAFIDRVFTFQTPTWLMLPATGFASVVFALLMTSNGMNLTDNGHSNDNNVIASFQDNAVIEFSPLNAQPGIGFFNAAINKSKPFNDVSIMINNNGNLKFNWPEVDNVVSYLLAIRVFRQGEYQAVKQKTIFTNSAEFNDMKLHKFRRYQWMLTGKTTGNETFKASGGFVSN